MRFLASGNFLFAAAIFFLPWLDVRCEMAGQRLIILEQSGYEAASGKFSEGSDIRKMREMANDMGGGAGAKKDAPKNDLIPGMGEANEEAKAPVLWIWLGLVGAGAVLCIAIPGRTGWRAGAILCILGAGGALGYQTAVGFPVAKELEKKMEAEDAKKKDNNVPRMQGMPDMKMKNIIVVKYQPAFYLAWLLTILPALWVLIDAMKGPPRKRREFDDYDYDDRDRDEHDDRRDRDRRRDDDRRNPFNDD